MLNRRMLLRALAGAALAGSTLALAAEDKKEPDKKEKEKEKGGTVTGELTAKGDNWIEVKADGEEKARRYTPKWVGGLPKDGGGFDKEILQAIGKIPLKSRVRLEWTFQERARVVKIEVLKKAEEKKD